MGRKPEMIDLAITPEERKGSMPAIADANPENMPKYPWGTAIRLENETLEKLGVDISDWEVGDNFEILCEVKVTSKSENDTENGGKRCCAELQITSIGAESEPQDYEEGAEHEGGEEESEPLKKKGRPNYYFD